MKYKFKTPGFDLPGFVERITRKQYLYFHSFFKKKNKKNILITKTSSVDEAISLIRVRGAKF